jgi:hypothetical protein
LITIDEAPQSFEQTKKKNEGLDISKLENTTNGHTFYNQEDDDNTHVVTEVNMEGDTILRNLTMLTDNPMNTLEDT